MKKNTTTIRMSDRFKVMNKFIGKNGRIPTHTELSKIFKLSGVGAGTTYILECYAKSLKICPVCKRSYPQK